MFYIKNCRLEAKIFQNEYAQVIGHWNNIVVRTGEEACVSAEIAKISTYTVTQKTKEATKVYVPSSSCTSRNYQWSAIPNFTFFLNPKIFFFFCKFRENQWCSHWGQGGQSATPDSEKFAKNREKEGKNQEKSGILKAKIGKVLSLCPSRQIGLATLLERTSL